MINKILFPMLLISLFGCTFVTQDKSSNESNEPDLANLRKMPSMVCDSNAINRREVSIVIGDRPRLIAREILQIKGVGV
jgi:hypothetical protein